MTTPIIGLDMGNSRIFCAFIADMDMETRRGGTPHSLLPNESRYNSGIPSTYFYSKRRGEAIGAAALASSPRANQRNLIKRRVYQTKDVEEKKIVNNVEVIEKKKVRDNKEVIDGKTVCYDDVFTQLVEHAVRIANEVLYTNFRQTTNLISLAYPAHFNHAELAFLISLAQKATLADGRHVEVVRTVPEPVAAALSELGENPTDQPDQTVAVIDTGAGTTDFCIASVHLADLSGKVDFYDILATNGYRTAGNEFTNVMLDLIRSKAGNSLDSTPEYILFNEAERMKIELSSTDIVYADLTDATGVPLDIAVTLKEYETAAAALVNQMVTILGETMKDAKGHKPDKIILTGGQSQMPMLRRVIAEKYPEYKGKILCWQPQRAIAFGAARYGVLETGQNAGKGSKKRAEARVDQRPPIVRSRNQFALGLLNVVNRASSDRREANEEHVSIIVDEGTQLPTPQDQWLDFQCLPRRGERLTKWTVNIVEATRKHPDIYQQKEHFRQTMSLELDFGHVIAYEQPFQLCLYVDKDNFIHAIVRDSANPTNTERHVPVKLLNLE